MAGALPAEEYGEKLKKAGCTQVRVTVTKPHEINMEVVKSSVMDLTEADMKDIEGVSASALITAVKP